MNYLGRARRADGSPEYEATYEMNASLEMSEPEFQQLISHEVVPGHVTTFAYLQNLFVRGLAGFAASVLAMNTRDAVLSEGIANNAILIAHGVTEVQDLPDRDLEVGVLLALLQDDEKNQSSYLTWQEGRSQAEVAAVLRRDFLCPTSVPTSCRALGSAPAARPHVPACVSGRDRPGGRVAAEVSAGSDSAGALWRARAGGFADAAETTGRLTARAPSAPAEDLRHQSVDPAIRKLRKDLA